MKICRWLRQYNTVILWTESSACHDAAQLPYILFEMQQNCSIYFRKLKIRFCGCQKSYKNYLINYSASSPVTITITREIWGRPVAWYFWSRSCTICIYGKESRTSMKTWNVTKLQNKKVKLQTRKPSKLAWRAWPIFIMTCFLGVYRHIEHAREVAK